MPSAYTLIMEHEREVTAEEFILRCARAFGALVTMRDESLDTPIPDELQPSDYHIKRYSELTKEQIRVSAMSEAEAEEMAQIVFQNKMKVFEENKKWAEYQEQKYMKLITQIEGWTPPSSHTELKSFALKQLRESLKFDVHIDMRRDRPIRLSGEQWRREVLTKLEEDIPYHKEKYAEECQRIAKANEWIKALRESLKEI